LVFLIFFFCGFRLLRKMFDNIKNISARFSKTAEEKTSNHLTAVTDELGNIVQSFRALEEELRTKVVHLEKKTSEVEMLKELSDLSYMTLNADYLLFIALERALKLVNADIGSVMILSRPNQNTFVIKASIGLSDHGKKGTIATFDDSIAKYTVINKAPLLVEDIENDSRFGRQSRGQYATKSFVCMPLKTSNEVIGVVTISRRRSDLIFTQADVDVLTPLLSNAAYIYDNINLFQETAELTQRMNALRVISKAINSSLQGQEMMHALFEQMRKIIPFDVIVLLGLVPKSPQRLSIVDFKGFVPTNLSRGRTFTYEGSTLDQVIKEQRSIFIPNVDELTSYIDQKLLKQNGIHTSLIIPLTLEGEITGLVMIYNITENNWNKQTDVIDLMVDHLALAIQKERMNDLLGKRDRELESLRLIGSALSMSTFNIDTILNHAMEMIQVVLPVEAGYVMLHEHNELAFAAALHLDLQMLKKIRLQKGEGIAGHVFNQGAPVIVNDAQQNSHFLPIVDRETGFTTRSILSIPLIAQGQVIGVIELLNKIEGTFNEADEKLIQSIASTVSIALQNARLYQEKADMAVKERDIRNAFQEYVPPDIMERLSVGQ
jgi:GAF domain-containing protein